jgi:CHASE1-domain containing sensor protein
MKRRKVLSAAFFYLVMSWLLLQIVDVVGPILDLPGWVAKLIFLLLLGGLPIALILSWEFDLTNLGVYREKPLVESDDRSARGDGNLEANRAACLFASVWVVFIGTILSVDAAAVIHLHEARMIDRQFDLVAQEIAHELSHHLNSDSDVLRTLGALFARNQQPSLETFRHISEAALADHGEIRAVEWVPMVTDGEREAFVTEMREIYPGFDIKAFDETGHEIPTQQRDIYFPVTFTVPKVGNEDAIGFDLLSSPDRAAALRDAIESGTARQTRPIDLVQSNATGLLMFNPVFKDDEVPVSREGRFENLRGFTLGVIEVRELVKHAVLATPSTSEFLGEITIYDEAVDSVEPAISINSGSATELSGSTRATATVDTGFGQRYRVELRPTKALVVGHFSHEHYIVGGIGILLSLLCAMILNAISKAREMPTRTKVRAGAGAKPSAEASLRSASDQEHLPVADILGQDRNWSLSRWDTS